MRRTLVLCLLFVSPAALSETHAPKIGHAPARVFAQPPVHAAAEALPRVAHLPAMSDGDLAAIRSANATQSGRTRNGTVRALEPVAVSSGASAMSAQTWNWRGSVRVDSAHMLRLELTDVNVARDATFWVSSASTPPIAFDTTYTHAGTLWTPTVAGDEITLEVVSRGGGSFNIGAVADLRDVSEPQDTSCLRDASCQSQSVLEAATAIGRYSFISFGASYLCSGGLIIDGPETFTPYFLTANHCITFASEASSMEVYWDYRTRSCNGSSPSLFTVPRTRGATLIANSANTDVSLVRLADSGGTRWFLGWTTQRPAAEQTVYRVSHPGGGAQKYSEAVVDATGQPCTSSPRPRYIYTRLVAGGTTGGSSGAPAYVGNGVVVGQLRGGCGPDPEDACLPLNREVDGSLAESWPLLQPYLNPQPATCSACAANATTACLIDNRFKVTVKWEDRAAFPVVGGNGKPIKYTENKADVLPGYGTINEYAFFSTYDSFPNAPEVIVKIVRGVNLNNKFWVLATGFAAYEYSVTVQDTKTCATWTRTNAQGQVSVIRDYEAFPFP